MSSKTGSQSDLPKLNVSAKENQAATRKRKLHGGESEIKFHRISDRRCCFFQDLKKSQCEELEHVRSDVTDIKNQLLSIRDANEKLICEQGKIKKIFVYFSLEFISRNKMN